VLRLVLDLEIGIHESFFEIGGDSISAMQLVSLLRRDEKFPFIQGRDITRFPTISQLSRHLSQSDLIDVVCNAEQGNLSGTFTLLPIQQWFLRQEYEVHNHFNQAFVMHVPLNTSYRAVEQALSILAEHHDMLRCGFDMVEETQSYHQTGRRFDVVAIDVQQVGSLENELSRLQAEFDIEQGLLWRAAFITGSPDGKTRLWFAFHHIIVDAVSWRIIADDMKALLSGSRDLGKKTTSYREWVSAVSGYGSSLYAFAEGHYWDYVLSLYNKPYPIHQDSTTTTFVEIDKELTSHLLHKANAAFKTQINDLLLSALGSALAETLGQKTVCITMESIGREVDTVSSENQVLDLSRTVGWFTAVYPVAITHYEDMADMIVHTKEMLEQVPAKGLGFGAISKRWEDMPNVVFNYLGQFQNTSDESECSIIDENTGVEISPLNFDGLALNINGAVFDDQQLRFSVVSRLGEATTNYFNSCFKQRLTQVISCARSKLQNRPQRNPGHTSLLCRLNPRVLGGRNLFAIHPAGFGVEAYTHLGHRLAGQVNCIGIDNHNLRQPYEMTSSLQKVAGLYTEQILHFHNNCLPSTLMLLGWSMGGRIALEMATQLETHPGVEKVHVFVLDTIDFSLNHHPELSKGNDEPKQFSAFVYHEQDIAAGELSQLQSTNTHIHLFKAMQIHQALTNIGFTKSTLLQHMDNGLPFGKAKFDTIPLHETNHVDMLKTKETLDAISNVMLTL